MLPSSNPRLYVNAPNTSKTMSKFYKKLKPNPNPTPLPNDILDDIPNVDYNSIISSVSPKKHQDVHYKKVKTKTYTKQKKEQHVNENNEEFNYIGDKEDLKNLDFLFREATGYEIGDDSDSDSHPEKREKGEKGEKGEKYEKHTKVVYPFSHKYSSHLSQDYLDDDDNNNDNNDDVLVEFLIYKVNNYGYKPFMEFMLYKSDNTFYLPNVLCNTTSKIVNGYSSDSSSDYSVSDHSDSDNYDNIRSHKNKSIYQKVKSTLDTIFDDGNYKIKGRLIPSKNMNSVEETCLSDRYILFIEYVSHHDKNNKENEITNYVSYVPEKTKLWWVTISEIFNYKKVLFFPVHDSVVNLFYSYPEIMNIYITGKLIEIPIVVYNGNNANHTKYNAIFSLKKSSQFSRYGPFYYFTDLHSSFKYACYDIENNMHKFETGGLLRTILFPQKIKMFLERDKIDDSIMAQYVFRKHPEKINTGQFRDNDNKWTRNYNTAYNGEYINIYDKDNSLDNDEMEEMEEMEETDKIDNRKEIKINKSDIKKNIYFPVIFCISEYNQQQVLSYHYIDTHNVPDIYSYEFKEYKIM
jgi:hypothetical protein